MAASVMLSCLSNRILENTLPGIDNNDITQKLVVSSLLPFLCMGLIKNFASILEIVPDPKFS